MAKPARARVSDVLGTALASAVARFDANEPALWTERDPEALHQARIATRRVRSDLRTLHEFVDPRWAQGLRAELRWFGAELGAVRDIEVLLERLSLHTTLLPDAEAQAARIALRRLVADHVGARADLLRTLRTSRYAELHRTLHNAVASPRLTPAAHTRAVEALPAAVRPTWRKLRRAVDALGAVPSDAALHEVRIRTKRCRYAVELASPVIGRPARALAGALTRVQDVLGEHQDAVVADNWLAKAAPECSPAEAYALGMLAEVELGLAVRAIGACERVGRGARAIVADMDVTGADLVRAAGGVVTRAAPASGIEVLVVHRPRYDDWSLPKGKVEPGETDEDAALREVEEETGYQCTLGDEMATVRYLDRKGRNKRVRFWHMSVRNEVGWTPNDEIDDRRWISPADAATLLTYQADRDLLRNLG